MHIILNEFNLSIVDDNGQLVVDFVYNDMVYNGNNLIAMLYYSLNEEILHLFNEHKDTELFNKFISHIMSLRKNSKEYFEIMTSVIFNGYLECSVDKESLIYSNANKYLGININEYIYYPQSISEYILSNEEYYLSLYETIHDQILLKLTNCSDFEIIIDDCKVDAWEDYDSSISINWKKLETFVSEQFSNNNLSVYAIRKVRKDISKFKMVTTNSLHDFAPLKDIYERKYYTPKDKND